MKRLMFLAALTMMTLSMAGCCRNQCRPGLFGGGGLFGHRGERECCDAGSEMSETCCDPCSGGSGGEVMMGPPPGMIGPPMGR